MINMLKDIFTVVMIAFELIFTELLTKICL